MMIRNVEYINSNIIPGKNWKEERDWWKYVLTSPWHKFLAQLQNFMSLYTYEFFVKNELKTLHLPLTTGSISSPMGLGSDSKPVEITIANQKTFLADSMQFMLEYGCRLYEKGSFYLMPSFRGEQTDSRHLSQFFHSEAEIPGKLADVKCLVEDYIFFLCDSFLKNNYDMLLQNNGTVKHIENMRDLSSNHKIPSLTLNEAVDILEDNPSFVNHHKLGYTTITSDGELELIQIYQGVVWLTHFDFISVPFYQAKSIDYPGKAQNADLLFGIGEVVGSGERHIDGDQVLDALKEHEVRKDSYEWYIEMKQLFPIQTSGFGMGIERFLLWLTNEHDIRDFQILPRENGKTIIP